MEPVSEAALRRQAKAGKPDAAYKEEHFILYRAKNLQWPPNVSEHFDGFDLDFSALAPRQVEMVLFCHQVWPAGGRTYTFLDVNPSLGLIVHFKNGDPDTIQDPWAEVPRTLVGSSTVVIR
eukprot:4419258-Lingulodinium_polyedra.AAC.1